MVWFQFLICSALIIAAGAHLTIYADKLADRLNVGKAWVGVVLLGLITSLPEAVTCVVSIRSLNADDLAVGNLVGSNNFNPMLIVIMDIAYRQGSVTDAITPHRSHKISAIFAVLLTAVVALEIFFSGFAHLGPLSIGGALIVLFYFVGMQQVAQFSDDEKLPEALLDPKESLSQIWAHLFVSAVIVIGAAIHLTGAADTIAETTGLGRTFVGSIFLALVTSLPEMVVSLQALRLGALDLAIGNIFGSNMTNMFIVFLCSLVNVDGPILYDVSNAHILTALLSMILIGISWIGINSQNKKKFLGVGWDSYLMLSVFLLGTAFLYAIK